MALFFNIVFDTHLIFFIEMPTNVLIRCIYLYIVYYGQVLSHIQNRQ